MATHLAASMRVVASVQHRRVSIADAREAVLEAAQRVEDGIPGPETLTLVERLEKVTGAGLVELAHHAADWS